ncbi:MAG: class I SAM-dependent methyltransferase, partial [Rhodospirillaceae bacterium]|nr:class I SAM-dependent methyltransferase [Rhodospirillaceae bacterium]
DRLVLATGAAPGPPGVVADLHAFYASPTGLMARRLIRRKLRLMWPNVGGATVLGFGYATPYLRTFHREAVRVCALMPPQQGILQWTLGGKVAAGLADETMFPLPDGCVDRLLLIHAVEASEALRPMLAECWRVMSDGGRMIVVAPNRRGIWARLERTPFGQGRPFSEGQIRQLLRETQFTPVRSEAALFAPPIRRRAILSTARAWERAGERWLGLIAGVTLTEATKQVYSAVALPVRSPFRILPAPVRPATARKATSD